MNYTEERAYKTAEYLLQIKAIKLNPAKPFTWASGWKSPIYCDNRKTLSYPQIRTYLRQEMVKLVEEEFGDVDLIAGVATGGVALGAWLLRNWANHLPTFVLLRRNMVWEIRLKVLSSPVNPLLLSKI
jgi:orotate phosphoribosyltransferase